MPQVSRVVAVVNDLKDLNFVAQKSVELAKIYNASIEVLFVKEKHFTIDSLFFDDEVLNKDKVEQELKKSFQKLDAPKGIAYFVKIDDTADRVWSLVRDEKDAIVVMPFYKDISKEVVNNVSCDVYILKDDVKTKKALIVVDDLDDIKQIKSKLQALNIEIDEVAYNYNYIAPTAVTDPVVDTNMGIEQELLQMQENQFKELLQKEGLKGRLFINSLDEDLELIDFINSKTDDLIVLSSNDIDIEDIKANVYYIR